MSLCVLPHSGISSMTSTLVLGPLLDLPAVRRHRLIVYNASNLVFGSGTLLFGFVSDYGAYVSISAVVSATAGVVSGHFENTSLPALLQWERGRLSRVEVGRIVVVTVD